MLIELIKWSEQFYPVCFFYKITGLYCPGCGTLRAIEASAAGDFWTAFLYNPFLFIAAIPFILYMIIIHSMRRIKKKWIPSIISSPKSALPVGVAIIAIWVFRNVFPLGLALQK
jgi:hypothetical protein